jgi:hypothetical protein
MKKANNLRILELKSVIIRVREGTACQGGGATPKISKFKGGKFLPWSPFEIFFPENFSRGLHPLVEPWLFLLLLLKRNETTHYHDF